MVQWRRYYTIMLESKDARLMRHRLVQSAKEHGIKPAAREFLCSPNTVRKWLRRFNGTLNSLQSISRRPHRSPNKLSRKQEKEIIRAKKNLISYGAARLKREMQLPYSEKAIRRVCREQKLVRKWRRKKQETKRLLRDIKKKWAAWKQISTDTKYLTDMPEYWIQARMHKLPWYQYTARDVSTGALFLSFSDELSITYATLFARRIMEHLKGHGVELPLVTVQTDNGTEFIGSWQAKSDSAFTIVIEGFKAHHKTIPPGAHRFQADVETVHSLMEYEFYIEHFKSRQDFIKKAADYQYFFNYVRKNSGKENKAPFDLLREKDLKVKLTILDLQPVFLEDMLKPLPRIQGVHDVWTFPLSYKFR
jgi:transposase